MLEAIAANYETLKDHLTSVFEQISDLDSRRILIKPNLGGRYPILESENNSVRFINIICNILLGLHAKEIIIAHSSLIGFGYSKYCNYDDLIKINHYDKLKDIKGVSLLNLDDVAREKASHGGYAFNIPKILKDEKIFHINLCKMKTHMETTVSLSLKNQMGLVSLSDRKNMHRTDLHSSIANLSKIIVPGLNIVDGIVGMEGNGPHHGRNRKTNLVVIGDNAVEVDSLACYFMGIDYEKVRHISEARRISVGNFINDDIKKKYEALVAHFKKADSVFRKGLKLFVWPTTSCSACIFSLSRAFDELIKKHPLKALKRLFIDEMNIIIGRPDDLKTQKMKNIYALGDCCKNISKNIRIKRYLKGCPPGIDDIIKVLKA